MNKHILITGTSKGIGKYLAEYYVRKGNVVIGCSRRELDFKDDNYKHFSLSISDETNVKKMCAHTSKSK